MYGEKPRRRGYPGSQSGSYASPLGLGSSVYDPVIVSGYIGGSKPTAVDLPRSMKKFRL